MTSLRTHILSFTGILALGCMLPLATPASGGVVLDQENATGTAGFNASLEWSQSFKPAYNNITGASVFVYGLGGATGDLTLNLRDSACGTVLATGSTTFNAAGWIQVTFGGGPIPVVAEQEYWLEIISTDPWQGNSNSSYDRGDLYLANLFPYICDPYDARDAFFRTYSDDAFSPIPVQTVSWGLIKSLHD